MAEEGTVEREEDESRFVLRHGDEEAELTYRLRGDRLVLVHTGVPDSMGGRGVGAHLVRAALDVASSEALTVVPNCPFARKWMQDHPEALDGISVQWPASR